MSTSAQLYTPSISAKMNEVPAADRSEPAIKQETYFLSDFESDTIRITVEDGGTSSTHHIHKQLLFRKSDYFGAMANFNKGEENHIVLKDINHNAFRHISYWIYRDDLDGDISSSADTLMHTWIAADRLVLNECKTKAMDCFRSMYCSNGHAEASMLTAISLGFTEEHPILRFLLDQTAWEFVYGYENMEDLADTFQGVPQALMKPLMAKIGAQARE